MVKTGHRVTYEELTAEPLHFPIASASIGGENKGFKRLTINLTVEGVVKFGVGHLASKSLDELFFDDLKEAIEEYNKI